MSKNMESEMENVSGLKAVGVFKVVEKHAETGEVIDTFEEQNVITDLGIENILRSFSDGAHVNNIVSTISLGIDVGSGDILNPEQPSSNIVNSAHDSVYVIPSEEFFVSYPDASTVRFFATVNGSTVMSDYPAEPNVIYTSAMLQTAGATPKAFAYKRFSARTVSSLISVDISWEIKFIQS